MKKYNVIGMHCAVCVTAVENAVRRVPGVMEVSVSLMGGLLFVDGDFDENALKQAVDGAGYTLLLQDAPVDKTSSAHRTAVRLWQCVGLLIPLLYLSLGATLFNLPLPTLLASGSVWNLSLQALLSSAIAGLSYRYFVSAFRSIKNGSPNMDVLTSLGVAVSLAWGYAVLVGAVCGKNLGMASFESAGMIFTFVSIGKTLEEKARVKTTDATASLLKCLPSNAIVLRNGQEVAVPLSDLKVGDVVVVKPGARLPGDGIVTEGHSAVDESAFTGESMPNEKSVSAKVLAGTLNTYGTLTVRLTAVGEDNSLSRLMHQLQQTASGKAPIARTADRIASVFVPLVVGLSLVTLAVWLLLGRPFAFALTRAVAVLVVSCPCALGLATPVALTVAVGTASKNGVLFYTASALETAGRVDCIVTDKTGTLTVGHPTVARIYLADGVEKSALLSVAYSLEKNSEHPLARAVTVLAQNEKITPLPVSDFRAFAGGVSGVVEGELVFGGNVDAVRETLKNNAPLQSHLVEMEKAGETALFFVRDGVYLGALGVTDVLRSDAKKAVTSWRAMGLETVLLTGDRRDVADRVGEALGFDGVTSGVTATEKPQTVNDKKRNKTVLMLGDGMNDASALATADLGLAMGSGTETALSSGDGAVLSSSLLAVTRALLLGRKTLTVIKQNLAWAFAYNLVMIPLAGGVFDAVGLALPPALGVVCMSASSLFVVFNALRLCHCPTLKLSEEKTMRLTLKIDGMMCPHCEARVKNALQSLDGATDVFVSHETGVATLILPDGVADETVKSTVEKDGYTVKEITHG